MDKSAIIIGGGLGGLFTGAILAKEGVKTTVVEKNATVGGGLQSFTRFGEIFDTGMHVIGGMQHGGNIRRICDYLGISDKVHIADLDGDFTDELYFAEDGKRYHIAKGQENFVNALAHDFPHQRQELKDYVDAVYRLANDIDASASSDELYYVDSASHPQLNFTIGFPSIGKYRENSKGLFGGSYEHGTDTTFTGKFHGNGHVIHDLYICTLQAYRNSGFFLAIDSSAIVDSLEIRFVEFSGVTAGLAYVNRGTVDNVNVKCDNLEADVGLVYRNEGAIRQSSFEGFFGGYGRFGPRGGGLVYINEGTISESYVNADVERDMPYVIAAVLFSSPFLYFLA